jgi:4-aminobutyrate aminotransferase-like enzyme
LEAPKDYFKEVYARVRANGGVCIADEVQTGLCRTGRMWGFEHYDVIRLIGSDLRIALI